MAVGAFTPKDIYGGSPQTAQAQRVIAPVMGIDARNMLSIGDPMYSIYSVNLVPSNYGLKVRTGYREHNVGFETAPGLGLGVRTLIPSGGSDEDVADDKLFAVTNEGIWDATTYNTTPTLLLDFSEVANGGVTNETAGWGVYTQYSTDAGTNILFYADSANGLFWYSGGIWERTTITGVSTSTDDLDTDNVVFVTSHKSSIWMFEEGSSVAWYLPEGSITGEAVPFFFGSKFIHGGDLGGLFSWTIDGGVGIDDYFVAVGRAGDVIVYNGTSPADVDTWASRGQYFIGVVPKGNRFGSQQGGNLYLLSGYGLLSMGDLIQGVDGKDAQLLTDAVKIAPIIRADMRKSRTLDGWTVQYVPSQGALGILGPQQPDGTFRQYIQSVTNSGWGIWGDVPAVCVTEWGDAAYIGTPDNRVCVMNSSVDNVKITPDEGVRNGEEIEFSLLSTYQDYGAPAQFKRAKYIRGEYVATQNPSQTSKALYDYDLNTIVNTSTAQVNTAPDGLWQEAGVVLDVVSLWDQAIWFTGIPEGYNAILGGAGMGRMVAIATKGRAVSETTLISWDVIWDSGGPL